MPFCFTIPLCLGIYRALYPYEFNLDISISISISISIYFYIYRYIYIRIRYGHGYGYRYILYNIFSFSGNTFEILPSKKIVIDKGDNVTVTCRYNGHCDASLYKKGYRRDPVNKQLKQSNITKITNELTWKKPNFQESYKGIYFCELSRCAQSANNDKKTGLEIEVKGKYYV